MTAGGLARSIQAKVDLKKLQAIKEAATHYRVAGNWRTVSEEGERYGQILKFLESCEGVPADDGADFVIRSAESLKQLNDDRNR